VADFHPAFKEAAYRELAQGAYAKNEALAFVDIPDFLMADSLWAWEAGWQAAFDSLGLTPARIRELEAQYHAALEPVGPTSKRENGD
jgi:hypothetical protein